MHPLIESILIRRLNRLLGRVIHKLECGPHAVLWPASDKFKSFKSLIVLTEALNASDTTEVLMNVSIRIADAIEGLHVRDLRDLPELRRQVEAELRQIRTQLVLSYPTILCKNAKRKETHEERTQQQRRPARRPPAAPAEPVRGRV